MKKIVGILGILFGLGWFWSAAAPSSGQLVSIAIVPFHDESDAAAPGELLDKTGQAFRQKLALSHKDVLPRLVSGEAVKDPASIPVGDLAAIGKQQGAKFVVRGGILAVTWEKSGRDLKCGLQLFADIVDAESQAVSALRAEGEGVQKKADLEEARRWDAYSWNSPAFAKTALGQALEAALTSLADQVHAAALDTASWASGQAQPAEGEAALPSSDDPYQTDQDLQQLIAQAESLIASGGTANLDMAPLQRSLEGIQTAMAGKVELMQQAQDTTAVDQDISQRRQELETLVNDYSQQVSANPPMADAFSGGGGNPDAISRVNGLIDGTLNLLQKIQELRQALGGSGQGQGYTPSEGQEAGGEEYYPPTEEQTASVSGVVTDDGVPVEGATVTDPETGLSATTDSDGSYTLSGLPGGRISTLEIARGGRVVGASRVELRPGLASISDCSFKSRSGGARAAAGSIMPSTLVLASKPGQTGAGRIEGTVHDQQGKPIPRALVSVKGVGAVRTDSQGRYAIANVPPGAYNLSVQQAGGQARVQQVNVGGRQTATAPIVYQTLGASGGKTVRAKALAPGENTILKGRVTEGKNKALGGAKLTVAYPGGALHVYSNSGGVYQVRNLKPGTYRVLASKPGYNGTSQTVAVQINKPSTLDFKMTASSSASVRQAVASQQLKKPASTAVKGTSASSKQKSSRTSAKEDEKAKTAATKTAKLSTATSRTATAAVAATGSVRGTVIDGKTRQPVAGATVSIKGKPGTQTDGSGRFSFQGVAPGSYSVSVKKAGYKSGGGSVTVRAGQTASASISLTKTEVTKTAAPTRVTIKK
jgi:protocatechuate 3,4-dioxygenase beta subunit